MIKPYLPLLLLSTCASAEQNSVETLVVTGTRSEITQSQSPIAIDVISAEQLQQLSHGTLASALNYIPGLVTKRNAKDGYTVQMQGFDGDHVLVLLDSQPLISPSGAAVDLDQISVMDIERIEVLRGAASVLYGSSAMGGVINIISRKQQQNHLKLKYQASSYANNRIDSSDLAQQFQVDVNQQLLGWQSSLRVQKIKDPGFDYDPQTIAQSSPSSDKTFVNLGLSQRFNDLNVALKSRFFSDDKYKTLSLVPGQTSALSYISEVEQWQQDLSLSQSNLWKVQGRYLQHKETSGDSNGLRDANIKLAEVDSQYQWHLGSTDVVSGLVLHRDALYQVKQATSTDNATVEVDDKTRNSIEGYTQLSWQWSDNEVLTGLRVQHDSDFGWYSAARVNGLFNLSDRVNSQWQLRLGGGQSYRVPTIKERYYVFDHSNLGYMVLGNAELEPETALSANMELSYHNNLHSKDKRLSLSANLHYAKASDFIDTVADVAASASSGLQVYRYANIDQAYLKGLDLTAQLNWQQLDYQLSYSYLHATNNKGQRLSDRPTHQIKTNLNWHLAYDLDALLYVVYEQGESPSTEQTGIARDHWSSVNLSLSQQLNEQWQWQAGIDNIFDNHQDSQAIAASLLDVRPLSSRRLFAGISYQFY